jgi:hypothetical protein
MAEPKIQIFKDKREEFRFRLVSENNEVVAASQGYDVKASARKGIDSLKRNAQAAKIVDSTAGEESGEGARFLIFKDKGDEFRFRLVAPNGEVVAASQGYDAKAGCRKGIEAVQRIAREGVIVDTTVAKAKVESRSGGISFLGRISAGYYFRGLWWRDVLTGSDYREGA